MIAYQLSDVQQPAINIPVSYKIESADNIQTITCDIDYKQSNIPMWLHPHHFEIKAINSQSGYMPLFNNDLRINSLDAALFIDKVYADIMLKEKVKVKR